MPKRTSDDALEEGLRQLRELRDRGLKCPARMPYGQAASVAAEIELPPHMVHAAQWLARLLPPAGGRRKADAMDAIEHLCRKHGWVPGSAHMIRVSAVPQEKGMELLKDTIMSRWSIRQLDATIAGRCGASR